MALQESMDMKRLHVPQLFEVSMVQKEAEIFREIMDDGGGASAEAFMANVLIAAPGTGNGEVQLHNIMHEDELEDEDLFHLF